MNHPEACTACQHGDHDDCRVTYPDGSLCDCYESSHSDVVVE